MDKLHEITVKYTYSELKRHSDYYSKNVVHFALRTAIFPLIIAVIAVVMFLCSLPVVGAVLAVGAVLGYTVILTAENSKRLKLIMRAEKLGKDVIITFYTDHITTDCENTHKEYANSLISSVYETDSNFYLSLKKSGWIIITRKDCSDELTEYLRNLKQKERKQ